MSPSSSPTSPVDPRALRDACGLFATGVNVIATRLGAQDHGMTANAFMSVSLSPPLIAISIATTARMLPLLRESGRFSVSVLAAGTQKLAWHFAGKPDPAFAAPFESLEGEPVVRGAAAAFLARTAQEIPAGDHVIFLGEVFRLRLEPLRPPLLFHKGSFGEIAEQSLVSAHMTAFGEGFW
ncbi:flavin reductase family protein [Neomegalonema sp.]|uniref:flavin reductase family protein n=1 Tax=Neomegalonema sp. TaxID=2039713 RepID=UPI002621AACD|nr:flavin reductase family protein [Neomegalonema sp.]MDD2869780.1 flavin reductase family protein [Neomegalonema sp.]